MVFGHHTVMEGPELAAASKRPGPSPSIRTRDGGPSPAQIPGARMVDEWWTNDPCALKGVRVEAA
jgi:hypothetical protein